ncbi:MAG: hypothetical protein M5U22_16110 [Thermoleophilia bacterium]|nr:hypothetical protein [Thermoleophilia bacterium]
MLCNLAVGAMEDVQRELPDSFTWTVVDASTREGVKRMQELRPAAGRQLPCPGVLVDGQVVFERIPDMEEFTAWLQESTKRSPELSSSAG